MRYARYKAAVAATLLSMGGYLAYIIPHDLIFGHRETFPVFSWALFAKSNRVFTHNEILIERINDTVFDPPLRIYELPEYFPRLTLSLDKAAQSLALALKASDGAEAKA